MADKVYVNGITAKAITVKVKNNGKDEYIEIMKLGIKSEKLIEFLARNTNEKGYCNVDILKRKEVGQYGDTHYAVLNEYKKEDKPMSASQIPDKPGAVSEEDSPDPFPF